MGVLRYAAEECDFSLFLIRNRKLNYVPMDVEIVEGVFYRRIELPDGNLFKEQIMRNTPAFSSELEILRLSVKRIIEGKQLATFLNFNYKRKKVSYR